MTDKKQDRPVPLSVAQYALEQLNMTDLRIDSFRAGEDSAWVNRTPIAVRITHLPTGAYVESKGERSVYQNKQRCMELLPAAIAAKHGELAKRGPVKSLYVEIKREEVEGMRARIAELEVDRARWERAAQKDWNEFSACMKEQRRGGVVPERDALRDIIAQAIGGDAYDCTRVWSAWGVGTMSDDDFVPVIAQEDRLYEIADACLDEVARLNPPGECVAVERELLESICSSNNNALSRLPELRSLLAQQGKEVGDE